MDLPDFSKKFRSFKQSFIVCKRVSTLKFRFDLVLMRVLSIITIASTSP